MNVEELKVLITAETKGLKQEVEKVKKMVEKLDKDIERSTSSINKSFKNMFKGVNFAAMTAGFTMLGKAAIDYASDLQEAQNVVEVAFGSMTEDINEWSKTTLKAFGLNELTTKRMAGKFMAMSNGMGIAADKGTIMAKSLTQLAGDIASFYNVDLKEAAVALDAVYTGETETLKRYGIVITEVNLQEYARRQGIQKSITQMTQMEKVMLRYNYIMEVTAQAQGDFARTSGNWANQVRLLREQFTQLMGVLGSGLIKVLTPVVKALNELLGNLINVANAIAVTFGGSGIQESTASVSSSIGDINSSIGDTENGLNNANTSAKKLAKTIAGFDELNILSTSSGGSGAGGDTALEGMMNTIKGYGEITPTEEYEGLTGKLGNYLNELKEIVLGWAKVNIPKLELNFDMEAAGKNLEEIGKNLTSIIAGWGTFVVGIGVEIANDLDIGLLANKFLELVEAGTEFGRVFTETVIPALKTFYEDSGLKDLVKWLGEKLADGLDFSVGIFESWTTWLTDNKDEIKTFAEELGKAVKPVSELAMKLGDIAWETIKTSIEAINTALQGIATSVISLDSSKLISFFSSFGVALLGIGAALKVVDIGFKTAFGKNASVKDTGKEIKKIFDGKKITEVFKDKAAMGDLKEYIRQIFKEGLFTGIMTLVDDILPELINRVKGYIKLISLAFKNGDVAGVLFGLLTNNIRNFAITVKEIATPVIKGLWTLLKTNPIAQVVAIVLALAGAIVNAYTKFEWFREIVNGFFGQIVEIFGGIGSAFVEMLNGSLAPAFKSISELLGGFLGLVKTVLDVVGAVVGGLVALVGGTFLMTVLTPFGKLAEGIIAQIGLIIDWFNGLITFLYGAFTFDLEKVCKGLELIFGSLGKSIVNIFKTAINMVIGFANGMIKGVTNAINSVIKAIGKIKLPDWVPGIGGKSISGSIPSYQIPYLANGGVITSPTVAMMGEYAGASNNPEIVAPQSILRETIENSNNNVVNALIQQTKQLLGALESMDMSVSIGDDVIAQAAQRGNQAYQRRTGKPLFA